MRQLFMVFVLVLLGFNSPAAFADDALKCGGLPYVENLYWTTDYGPAAADVMLEASNMVACTSGDYALCYYAGDDPAPCKVDAEKGIAYCECQKFTAGPGNPMFVDINAILNVCVYVETVRDCQTDGSGCAPTGSNAAPVCHYIANGTFSPKADLISTFSLETVSDFGLGCTDCSGSDAGLYAGCMTAPCYEKEGGDGTTVICECPLYDGPYQYGRQTSEAECNLGNDEVWSAAYNPGGCAQLSLPIPASRSSSGE